MKCPRCHMENSGESSYCSRCGGRMGSSYKEPESGVTQTYVPVRMEVEVGTTFAGRYQVLEELGSGGMGKVYKVVDKEINEKIALKILKPEISLDEKIIERFRNELKLARKISHPNVCRMYDLSKEKGMYFITMEYISGEDLKSTVSRVGQLSVGKTMAIARQICKGLAEAHKMGVVHRDLKPHNIIIDRDGDVRILDFGIAHSMKTQGITESGVMIGTPEYMSPEQAVGEESDERSDIYSLGVIMFELLTGIVPFKAETAVGVAIKQKMETPPSPKAFNQQIPDEVNRMVLRCLEKDKERRYQKVEEVLDEISRTMRGHPTTSKVLPSKPITSPGVRPGPRSRSRVIALTAALAVLLCGAGYLVYKSVGPEPIPSGQGLLNITTSPPGANVLLNNEPKGTTPLKAAFAVGTYQLKITLNDYREIAQDVQIAEGKTLAREFALERLTVPVPPLEFGSLDIDSIPTGASVYLNDESKGNTPTGKMKVSPGSYRLKITMAEHQDVLEDIRIEKNMTWSKKYPLERISTSPAASYSVLVTSEPSDARILFDGQYQSKTPATLTLAKNSGVLEIQKANYVTEKVPLTLKPGTNPEKHIKLKIVSVRIAIQTDPPDAKVTLDNIELGNSPTQEISIQPGRYKLKIEKQGYKPVNASITISKDERRTIPLVQLEKVMVQFISNAVAEIYLDGVLFKKERETSRSEYISVGPHRVEYYSLTKPEKRFAETVVFEPGRTYRVHGNVLTEKVNCIDTTSENIKKIDH